MSREAARVHQLTNDELIEVLRKRACDWNVLEAFKFLVTMMEKTATMKPEHAQGLLMAAGLVRLYGQSFANGDPEHPFQGELTLQTILHGTGPLTRSANPNKPKEAVEKKDSPVVKNLSSQPFIRTDRPTMKPKKWAPYPESKSAKARNVIMRMTQEFKISHLIAIQPDLSLADFNNALTRLKFDKDVVMVSRGVFKVNQQVSA